MNESSGSVIATSASGKVMEVDLDSCFGELANRLRQQKLAWHRMRHAEHPTSRDAHVKGKELKPQSPRPNFIKSMRALDKVCIEVTASCFDPRASYLAGNPKLNCVSEQVTAKSK